MRVIYFLENLFLVAILSVSDRALRVAPVESASAKPMTLSLEVEPWG